MTVTRRPGRGRERFQSALRNALRDAASAHGSTEGAEALVLDTSPVSAELVLGGDELVEGENLELSFAVAQFDQMVGLAVDDTLVVLEVEPGQWRAVGVLSDADPGAPVGTAAGSFRHVQVPSSQAVALTGGVATATYLFASATLPQLAAAGSGVASFSFDPADFSQPGRTTRVRLRLLVVTNAVAPGVSFTAALVPVTAFGGASGAAPTIVTVGAPVVSATVPAPAAAGSAVVSADADAPAAGVYALRLVLSGAQAANSQVDVAARLLAGVV